MIITKYFQRIGFIFIWRQQPVPNREELEAAMKIWSLLLNFTKAYYDVIFCYRFVQSNCTHIFKDRKHGVFRRGAFLFFSQIFLVPQLLQLLIKNGWWIQLVQGIRTNYSSASIVFLNSKKFCRRPFLLSAKDRHSLSVYFITSVLFFLLSWFHQLAF